MGTPMLWRLSFLACLLSPAISGNSLQGLISMGYRNSQTGLHIMHKRSAQIASEDNIVDIDEKSVQSKLSNLLEDNGNNERNNIYLPKEHAKKDRSSPPSATSLVLDIDNDLVGVSGLVSSSPADTKTSELAEEGRRSPIANRPSINRPNTNTGGPRHFSRIIPSSEYILPHQVPGGQEVLYCTRVGELHYFWSEDYDCLVCVCLQDLTAVCASCGGCIKPRLRDQPFSPPPVQLPPPSSSLVPHTIPSIPTLLSVPPPAKTLPEVICSPLPSNRPFQNPLNPCQTCICREQVDVYGKPDAQIDCHENSQCVLPPETIPPIPEPVVPVPLPLCDEFPTDVLFPHPTNVCLTCKCIVVPLSLTPIKHLSCSSNPECESVSPIPIPVPIPEPIPLPLPTIEPEPIPPGPLPGPSPHESCRPHTPNQLFQHPWDDCQLCMCTEGYAGNQVIVEVSCFTKKSCCLEYGQSKPLPLPHYPTGPSSIADASTIGNAQNGGALMLYNADLGLQFGGSQSVDAANAQAFANTLQEADTFAISNIGHNQYSTGSPGHISNGLAQGTGYPNIGQGIPFAETDALANLDQNYYVPYAQGGYPVQSALFPVQNPYGVADGGILINSGFQHNFYHNNRPIAGLVTGQTDTNAYPSITGSYVPGYNYPDTISIKRPGMYSPYQQQGQASLGFDDATAQAYVQGAALASADAIANSNKLDLFGDRFNYLAGDANANVLNGGYHIPGHGFNNAFRNNQAQPQANAYAQSQTMGLTSSQAFASSAIKSADPALENNGDYNE